MLTVPSFGQFSQSVVTCDTHTHTQINYHGRSVFPQAQRVTRCVAAAQLPGPPPPEPPINGAAALIWGRGLG